MLIGMRQCDKRAALPYRIERHHIPGRLPLILAHVDPFQTRFAKFLAYLHFFAGIRIPLQKIAAPQKLPKN